MPYGCRSKDQPGTTVLVAHRTRRRRTFDVTTNRSAPVSENPRPKIPETPEILNVGPDEFGPVVVRPQARLDTHVHLAVGRVPCGAAVIRGRWQRLPGLRVE